MKISILIFMIFLAITALISYAMYYTATAPNFGAREYLMNKDKIFASKNYKDGKFFNVEPTFVDISFTTKLKFFFFDLTRPKDKLPIIKLADDYFDTIPKQTRITWFGHSASLIELDGKRIFLDPMLSQLPSPISFLGKKRYYDELPMAIEKLPNLDAIVISHDHYDHLDYESILKIKDKTKHFYVPLGVGSHLIAWGVDKEKITELDWYESASLDTINFTLTPMRHFSGRSFSNQNQTLWGSWVIKGKNDNIFFSGDGGYSKYFKQIGDQYGPFDFTMIESGQYNVEWPNSHLMPKESIQAHIDLKGDIMMPIHWAAFTLSVHNWKDPIEQVKSLATQKDINITTPKIGESIILNKFIPTEQWWVDLR